LNRRRRYVIDCFQARRFDRSIGFLSEPVHNNSEPGHGLRKLRKAPRGMAQGSSALHKASTPRKSPHNSSHSRSQYRRSGG
jgi:hypothetical protein